jgi:hypothetical protein
MRLLLVASIAFAPINAATVAISAGSSWVTLSTVGNAKFRFSQTNWDQSLGFGSGTPNSSTFVARDLGNNTTLGNSTYELLLSYDPVSSGFAFSVSVAGSTAPPSTLQWMSSSPIGGRTPTGPFNAIEIEARAGIPAATLHYSDIRFSGNFQQIGSFAAGTVSTSTVSNGIAPMQWLVADRDLSQIAWTMGATISGQRNTSASNDEAVRFVFTVKSVETTSPQSTPEPSTWLMLTAGMLLMGMSILRNRRTENKGSGNKASRAMR